MFDVQAVGSYNNRVAVMSSRRRGLMVWDWEQLESASYLNARHVIWGKKTKTKPY